MKCKLFQNFMTYRVLESTEKVRKMRIFGSERDISISCHSCHCVRDVKIIMISAYARARTSLES